MTKKLKISTAIILCLCLIISSVNTVFAYFSAHTQTDTPTLSVAVNDLFGILDGQTSQNWGTTANPYLINQQKHLTNLYILQNTKDRKLIDQNTTFQISDEYGNPCFVGGTSPHSLLSIQSIGTEDFPFISKIYGVSGQSFTLPNGETATTSTIGNIQVTAYEGQVDIGLFGVIGNFQNPDQITTEEQSVGSVENLLLYNVQINTQTTGENKDDHTHHDLIPHETNHIGILAGHAQNATIKNISVYYTGNEIEPQDPNDNATSTSDVQAFLISAQNTAKYTSSGGIIGYYQNLFIGEPSPVSTQSFYDKNTTGGGNTIGSGQGIMFADNLWMMLDENTQGSLTQTQYDLQENFTANDLYENSYGSKNYFTRGVFTFAHSIQKSGQDRIVTLWADEGDSQILQVADVYTQSTKTVSQTSKYTYIQVRSIYEPFDYNFRYLIVCENSDGQEYVLTRNGDGVVAQQLDRDQNYITIPTAQLSFYTAKVTPHTLSGFWDNSNSDLNTNGIYFYYGPYYNEDGSLKQGETADGRALRAYSDSLAFAEVSTNNVYSTFFLTQGTNANQDKFMFKRAGATYYSAFNGQTNTFFSSNSTTQTTTNTLYFKIYKIGINGGGDGQYSYFFEDNNYRTFYYERVTNTNQLNDTDYVYFIANNAGTSALTRNNTSVTSTSISLDSSTASSGHVTFNSTAPIDFYLCNTISNNFHYSGYYLTVPTSGQSNTFGSGNASGTLTLTQSNGFWTIKRNASNGRYISNTFTATTSSANLRIYRIPMYFIESDQEVVYDVDTRYVYQPHQNATNLVNYDMSENVLFYTGNGTNYNYDIRTISSLAWGDEDFEKITKINHALVMADKAVYYSMGNTFGLVDVRLAESSATTSVPQGTVAFQIDSARVKTSTVRVNIIVATNPTLLVDQVLSCSYISGSNVYRQMSIPLPPAPGQIATSPINVTEFGQSTSRIAYTNFNTVLVGYTFELPVPSSGNRVYFLESEQGAVSFVYFSVEGTASDRARNPEHENDLFFNILNGIDYVYTKSINSVLTIIPVTHQTEYFHSLITPYFGYLPNTATADIVDDFIISDVYDLSLSLRRRWLNSGNYGTSGYGELFIGAFGANGAEVSFTECVEIQIDSSNYRVIVYADHVILFTQ